MPIKSRWSPAIPDVSLPTWIFSSPTDPLPNKPAYVDPDRPATHTLTYPAFRLLAKRIALGLIQHAALQKGDRVLVMANNSILYPAVFLGIIMAGGVFTGGSPAFKPRELAYQLRDSGARFVITSRETLEVALEAAREVGMPLENVVVFDDNTIPNDAEPEPTSTPTPHGTRHWISLLASPAQATPWAWPDPSCPRTTICCLNYSSGTTGFPKGVKITHASYVANGIAADTLLRVRPDHDAMLERIRCLCALPMYHVFSQTAYVANAPHDRATVYVMSRFDFPKMLTLIKTLRITQMALVPPILTAIAKSPLARASDLSSLERVMCGAAPLSRDLASVVEDVIQTHKKAQRVLAGTESASDNIGMKETERILRQGWGMTEMTCTGLSWAFDNLIPDVASVGELSPNCTAKLVDAADGVTEITAPRVPGELWLSSPTVMDGYWDNPQATAASLITDANGVRWLRTGDVAYVDKYGPGAHFYIVDRVKELIKVRGRQVAPAELESLLLEREDVADAAVVGVVVGGEEVPRAYLVRRGAAPEDGAAAEEEVMQWVSERVAGYKKLRGGVAFVDAIPKTASGKILRKVLRERAAEEVGDREPRDSRLA